ncbi:MAG TPA: ABC transporter ATP-binding protein [Candidatus Wunengus sp. YC61]|uniref:ABC transporter ATP-binding protein n=1 Tax=Candidatus Wunengus sp. YC61 TaxID=3367698 RepID=UPI004027A01B
MNKPIIVEAKNISKIYKDGQVKALDNVSLQIYSGEVLTIRGPSGSGKSTLLHLLGGLDSPTNGTVFFNEKPIQEACRHKGFRVKNMGFIFQAFYLWHNLNVLENVMLPLMESSLNSKERMIRAKEIVNDVGLTDKAKAPVKALSIGQRQRVAVARALVAGPSVIFADEPTGSLDSRNAENILQLLRRLNRQRNVTVIMVTHENISNEYYDRQVQVLDGKIIA